MDPESGLPMARVDFGGVGKEVCLALEPDAQVDDYVLVHVGFAISRIDEMEAQGVVGPHPGGSRQREVLPTPDEQSESVKEAD